MASLRIYDREPKLESFGPHLPPPASYCCRAIYWSSCLTSRVSSLNPTLFQHRFRGSLGLSLTTQRRTPVNSEQGEFVCAHKFYGFVSETCEGIAKRERAIRFPSIESKTVQEKGQSPALLPRDETCWMARATFGAAAMELREYRRGRREAPACWARSYFSLLLKHCVCPDDIQAMQPRRLLRLCRTPLYFRYDDENCFLSAGFKTLQNVLRFCVHALVGVVDTQGWR